jgi:hypothetical protein
MVQARISDEENLAHPDLAPRASERSTVAGNGCREKRTKAHNRRTHTASNKLIGWKTAERPSVANLLKLDPSKDSGKKGQPSKALYGSFLVLLKSQACFRYIIDF